MVISGRVGLILTLSLACIGAVAPPRSLPRHVVWVGAHPDDEIFAATLLHDLCVRGRASCAWIVLTRGEKGTCADDARCDDLVRRRGVELRRSAAALHASVEQWELADGAAFDPRDVLRAWSSRDCGSLLKRLRDALAGADLVLTFEREHGTSLHPDHRAAAILVLVATAVAGMPRRPRLYALMNQAEVTRGGTLITFAPRVPSATSPSSRQGSALPSSKAKGTPA
jgi:LmbE family N-acetylglucosaminyl deacetylase